MRASMQSNEGDTTEMEKEWQASILRCTNQLFVNLKIPTQPIRNFAELQKSASSMFVGIFETMFNLRLKNVTRNPRVVNDYVNNAQLVIEALAESLGLDLSNVTGEGIYRGDAAQIQALLDIFDDIWNQFFQPAEQVEQIRAVDDSQYELGTDSNTERQFKESVSNTPSSEPHLVASVPESNRSENLKQASPEKPTLQVGNGVPETEAIGESLTTSDLKLPIGRARAPKNGKARPQTTGAQCKQRRTVKNSAKGEPKTNWAKSRIQQKRSSQRTARERTIANTKKVVASANDVLDKVKILEKGSSQGETEKMKKHEGRQHDTLEELDKDIAEMEAKVRNAALNTLAEKFPDVYQSMWRTMQHSRGSIGGAGVSNSKGSANKNVKSRAKRNVISRKSPFTKRLQDDVERYQKTCKILLKQHRSQTRASSHVMRTRGRVVLKNRQKDRKTERIKSSRLKKSLGDQQKSKRATRSSKEEHLMRKLFQNAVKLEQQRLLAYKRAEEDRLEEIEREQLDRYESTQREYINRQELLQEKIQQHSDDQKLVEQAQRLALRHLAREVEQDYRQKLERMKQDWEQQEQRMLFANTQRITQDFETLNAKVADATANQIRALKDITDPDLLRDSNLATHQIREAAGSTFPQSPLASLSESVAKINL